MAEDNFDELSYLRPVLDADGQPVMSSGNFAVVFKMKDERDGKLYAVRCFHRDQEGRAESYRLIEEELKDVESPYLVSFRYMDKELYVDSKQSDETEFPVLLMDWVEGITLDKYLRENLDDQYALGMLAYRFSQLAQWLIPQPFAHGDLKPDNILVKEDGIMVLVDYDGMYVPAMKGQKARELGSPDFRHPLRTEDDFDEHIDDFPLVSILLSLKAISINPQLLAEYGATDRLLLSEKDYRNVSDCRLLKEHFPSNDETLNRIAGVLFIVLAEKELSFYSFRLLRFPRPQRTIEELCSTKTTDEDLANAWTDEYGVKYSADRQRLLKAPEYMDVGEYSIREGTRVICDSAFCVPDHCPDHSLYSLSIPNSVVLIGEYAFHARAALHFVDIPHSVKSIGEGAFAYCGLFSVTISCNVISIGNGAFVYCSELSSIIVEQGNKKYDSRDNSNAIIEKESNTLIAGCRKTIIPANIISLGDNAFKGCSNLISVNIPNSVIHIGDGTFSGCKGLTSIVISDNVTSIGKYAFYECSSLKSLVIPNSVTSIGENILADCDSLSSIMVKGGNSVYDSRDNCNAIIETKGNTLVVGCKNTIIPNSVTCIGKYAFYSCTGLTSLMIPYNITSIEEGAFCFCKKLISIQVEKGNQVYDSRDHCEAIIETASNTLVVGCRKTVIPNSVTSIGKKAFDGCENLARIVIPNSVKFIGEDAFIHCI